MHFAIRITTQGCVGNGGNTRTKQWLGVAHHQPQCWASQEFEADQRRNRVARQTKHRHSATAGVGEQTECKRLSGLNRDLHPAHIGDARQHGLHDVVVAHADTATGDDRVARIGRVPKYCFECLFVVAHDAEVDRYRSGLGDHADEHRLVALANLAQRKRAAIVDEFVAGGQHRNPSTRHDVDGASVHAGQHARHSGTNECARAKDRGAIFDVVACIADGLARSSGGVDAHDMPIAESLGVLNHHDGISALRHGSTGHDANRFATTQDPIGGGTGRNFANHRKIARNVDEVGGDDGVTIDSTVRKRRHVFSSDNLARQHAADGVGDVCCNDAQDRALRQHDLACIFDGNQTRDHGHAR